MKAPKFLFPHSAKYREEGGAYGDWGEWQDIKDCYMEYKRELVRDDEGDEIVSEATMYLPADGPEISTESQVEYDGDQRLVISTQKHDNALTGQTNHIEVVLE